MQYAYTNRYIRLIARTVDTVGKIFFKEKALAVRRGAPTMILVTKLDQLGDCFLITPIFECLKSIFPQAKIDVVCQRDAKVIFENNPFVRDIIGFNYPRLYRGKMPASMKDFLSLIRMVRKKKYNLTIDLRGEPFAALLGFLSGARDRIGFEKEEVGEFLYTRRIGYDRAAHEAERFKKVIFSLGGSVDAWKPCIYLTDEEKATGEKFIRASSSGGYVVVHPGSGSPWKIWPKERFAEIIRLTLEEYPFDVILLGGKDEKDIGDYITSAVHNERLKNSAGQWSLRESYFVISRAKAFLGNDSSLAHFAGALDIPSVDLMNAAANTNRWRALGTNTIVILKKEPGHHCGYGACPYPCPNMQAIEVEEVRKKWKSVLEKIGSLRSIKGCRGIGIQQ